MEKEITKEEFIKEYCLPKTIKIPSKSMGVCLSVTFDNSDAMTDYFDFHAKIGVDMLLAVVKQQRKTERLARSIIARYEELAKLEWEWRVENYSGGHGNYLITKNPVGTFKKHAYNGRKEVLGFYEVSFVWAGMELYPYKHYTGKPETKLEGQTIEIKENKEKKGIEIYFSSKPNEMILAKLKDAGWRWSKFNRCWYVKASDTQWQFAQEIARMAQ